MLYRGGNIRQKPGAALPLLRKFILGFLCACVYPPLQGVIFYSTADPNYNTTAPGGSLTGSGWDWVGNWNGFQGVPVGPHHFLTARHVGGKSGDLFVLRGVNYTAVAAFDDAHSDLRIWQINETFPDWPGLYRTSDEVGKPVVVFGRGSVRGGEVRDPVTHILRGWEWGQSDGRLRWGQNVVKSVINRGPVWGELLYQVFKEGAGNNEVHLALGDSSGPVFIHDGTSWKLAGIAAAVDASFNTTDVGPGFNAAIFDGRGLYYGSSAGWILVKGNLPAPSGFYATRISVRAAWLDQLIDTTVSHPVEGNAVTPEEKTGAFPVRFEVGDVRNITN